MFIWGESLWYRTICQSSCSDNYEGQKQWIRNWVGFCVVRFCKSLHSSILILWATCLSIMDQSREQDWWIQKLMHCLMWDLSHLLSKPSGYQLEEECIRHVMGMYSFHVLFMLLNDDFRLQSMMDDSFSHVWSKTRLDWSSELRQRFNKRSPNWKTPSGKDVRWNLKWRLLSKTTKEYLTMLFK